MRTLIAGLMLAGGLLLSAPPAQALGQYEKVWLRDTAIGAAGGLAISLVTERDTTNWVLAGAIAGAVFGYFDAEKGIISYTPERGWSAGSPTVQIDAEPTRTGTRPVLKALLVNAEW